MKFHQHVGVIETADAETMNEVLAVSGMIGKVLSRPQENLCIMEREDADEVIKFLEQHGMHPKVSR
ncbi:MAG: hypothetical protein L3J82_10165 [Planctomycetes bacterium]|nr:hypothetical protein [Planctomycetota bacterium]